MASLYIDYMPTSYLNYSKIYNAQRTLSELRRYVQIRGDEYRDPSLPHMENIIEYLSETIDQMDDRIVELSTRSTGP